MCFQRHVLALAVLVLLSPAVARADVFTVNSVLDLPDDVPGDGVCAVGPIGGMAGACTLRAAIMEANALGGEPHVINLPAGVYQLTRISSGLGILAGLEEDNQQLFDRSVGAAEGAIGHDAWNDLDIGVDLTILGAGEAATIVEGNAVDRVFHVLHQDVGRPAPQLVRFSALTIRNGHTFQRGAGVFVNAAREAYFDDVTIADNQGTAFFEHDGLLYVSVGGGIHSQAYSLFLNRSTLQNNFAVTGGGLAVAAGWATLVDTTIEGNEARSPGSGAPDIVGGRVGFGGGIALLATETSGTFLWMSRSTLNDNRALYGGGLGAFGGFSIVNSTLSDNSAGSFGGGAYVRTPIGARISHFQFTTIAGNTATSLAGGIYREPFGTSRLQVQRTIVAGNAPANCATAPVGPRPSMSNGNNLDDGNTCGFTATTDLSNTDPLLGSLRNNGGPTFTRALLQMSPAIDRAGHSGWHEDQRGELRPYGRASDIGAYERTMPRLRVPFPIPDRFEGLFGFSVRIEVGGTSGATLKEIVPAMDGLKLSVEVDKSGRSAVVSASGLKIDVNALKKLTNQKQPALFYVGADSLDEGSEFLVITEQRFDAKLAGVTKLPFGQK